MHIIATIGPSCRNKVVIKELINHGVDIFRFNFSHGNLNEFSNIKKIIKEIDKNIHIMGDLSGAKIRISDSLPYIYKIYNGEEVLICGEDKYIAPKYNKRKLIPLNLNSEMINKKNIKNISMKDNTMHFKIIEYTENGIKAIVKRGGIVRGGKGCNIKSLEREKGIITARDKICLDWCVEENIEIICQSFVEEVEDIIVVKEYIKNKEYKYKPIIWGKIETPRGIANGKEIEKEVDGIVIGRGDLIPESNLLSAPVYQDRLLNNLNENRVVKDIIIGTHILNSMKQGKRPEFAEVDSIYNMIKKNVTGFLLSGETSIGKAPVETVKFLKRLIRTYN